MPSSQISFDIPTILREWFSERASVSRGMISIPAEAFDLLIDNLQEAYAKAAAPEPDSPMFTGSPAEQAHLLKQEALLAEVGAFRGFIMVSLAHDGSIKYLWSGNTSRIERAGLAALAAKFYTNPNDPG